MQRRGFTLVELLVVLLIAGLIAAIIYPVIVRIREPDLHRGCQPNLKQIGLGFMQYQQDYDDEYPPAAINTITSSVSGYQHAYGWADALQPYVKSTELLQCRAQGDTPDVNGDAAKPGFTDYWFNAHLAGLQQKKVAHPTKTLLCGDGNDGTDRTDARYNLKRLPLAWISHSNSPARRHYDGANYLYVDGHVKWHKAAQAATLKFIAN